MDIKIEKKVLEIEKLYNQRIEALEKKLEEK